MRLTDIKDLFEAAPGLKKVGVPSKLVAKLAKEYNFKHDTNPKLVNGTPTMAKAKSGLLLRVQNDGTAYALRGNGAEWTIWRYDPKKDKVSVSYEKKWTDAKNKLGAKKNNGKYYFIVGGEDYRSDKPSNDTNSVKDRNNVGSGGDVYAYMNKTFLPKIRDKLNALADEIYAGLRSIPKDYDSYGDNLRKTRGYQSARESALKAAEAIEDIAQEGFNHKTMIAFINLYGEEHTGWGSIPANEEEIRKILKQEPNAHAKLAQVVLKAGQYYFDQVENLKARIKKSQKEQGK